MGATIQRLLYRVGRDPASLRVRRTAQLSRILADVDARIEQRNPVEAVLKVLDSSKRPMFNCLQSEYRSPVVAKALTLKILNLCLAKYHFKARSTTVLSRPFGLVMDPSNVCNLACPGCVHSDHTKELKLFDWKKGILSENRLRALLRRYGPYAIQGIFCNYGEPLVNQETPNFIRMAKSYLMGAMLSTSLSVPKLDAEAYVASGLDYMLLSIDGATQPVYERFRRKGSLEIVFRNLQSLAEAKRKLGKRTPVLVWRFLTFEHNSHEIPLAIETARRLGANQFKAEPPYDVSWDDPDIKARPDIEPALVKFDADDEPSIADNWNPFPDGLDEAAIESEFAISLVARTADAPAEPPPARAGSTCAWLYKNIVMDAGGRILPCCGAPRPDINLVFDHFDGTGSADPFNSERHRLSRLFFADAKAYRAGAPTQGGDPHCVQCNWNKTKANIDSREIKQYLRLAGRHLFDDASAEVLSSW